MIVVTLPMSGPESGNDKPKRAKQFAQGRVRPDSVCSENVRESNWPGALLVFDVQRLDSIDPRKVREIAQGLPMQYELDVLAWGKIDIEADGRSHRTARHEHKDEKRDVFLTNQGYTVLRFDNDDIFNKREEVMREIWSAKPE